MGHAERDSGGNGQSISGPAPGVGRKDLPDPDRDVSEPDRPAPDGEQERRDRDADRDADGGVVQLEIPATGERVAGE